MIEPAFPKETLIVWPTGGRQSRDCRANRQAMRKPQQPARFQRLYQSRPISWDTNRPV
jgi:hypothetical protein